VPKYNAKQVDKSKSELSGKSIVHEYFIAGKILPAKVLSAIPAVNVNPENIYLKRTSTHVLIAMKALLLNWP